jgi:hypothetical protein
MPHTLRLQGGLMLTQPGKDVVLFNRTHSNRSAASRQSKPGCMPLRIKYFIFNSLEAESHGFPIAIAIAAAKNGNGSDTAARNQTKRAGMNGISQSMSRWKANRAQATT